MIKKLLLAIFLLFLLILAVFLYVKSTENSENGSESQVLSPLAKKEKDLNIFGKYNNEEEAESKPLSKNELENKNILNILLLGIDRRSKSESSYRTDIMILVSINKSNNTVVLTSIPRDLWYGNGRINALFVSDGWETVKKAVGEITGQEPDRFVLTDFEDFSWIVDQMGGVEVNVATTFTDSEYPVDATLEYQTISFTQGKELLTGERALIFARSRKGNFDNGDWGRMRRQHLILKGMLESITQPQSFICKDKDLDTTQNSCPKQIKSKTLENTLNLVVTKGMQSNIRLEDLVYLWDFYTQKDNYLIKSLLMDYTYLHTPPASEYGGAWVLAPINKTYTPFINDLTTLLNDRELITIPQAPEPGSEVYPTDPQ